MAKSTCIKCEGTKFEIKDLAVTGAKFRLFAVQCASCGGVIGLQESHNTAGLLLAQNAAIKKIAAQVGVSVTLET